MSGPLIVTATFGIDDHAWLEGLRRAHYPAELNRVPVHLTLFHHLPPSTERELGQRLGHLAAAAPPRARIVDVMDLGEGTAFRVASDELDDIRLDLAEAFRGLLMPQDQAPWRPHVTVQNKVVRRDAIALQKELQAGIFPKPLAIRGLASWRYMDGPWEPVRAYPFRG
ncbi:2'-5' RNA ligase family protein [Sphingosinicella sp. YJ22]|uniref:2'-5' RNA ligase family protein n=1 Tax=Sphingosinicella sp. YJ22 TaxID=1104780 RepID=UPI001408492A|nr:2'-5' RNA ligase family protein [Sphingosinicella sp. YJ22]